MSIFSAIGKATAIWAKYGDRIEATMDIWLAESVDAAGKPADVANELRKAVGNRPMTKEEEEKFNQEQAWMNRTR